MKNNYSTLLFGSQDYQRGLVYCFNQAHKSINSSYCWLKSCEFIISTVIIIACVFEIYNQIKVYGRKFEWRFASSCLIIFSLLVNLAFCLWNEVYVLYSLESFVFCLYFLTIFGYVLRLYMRKNRWDSVPRNNILFIFVLGFLSILYAAIFIDSIVKENSQAMVNKSCQQIWYLCINIICLVLCIIASTTLYFNQREERQKIQNMSYDIEKIRDPFMSLWLWIGFNTLAQIVNLIESGLLISTTRSEKCMIIPESQLGNNFLCFFFSIFTLTAGFAATLIYFRHLRNKNDPEQPKLVTSVQSQGNLGVQLFLPQFVD